MGILSKCVAAAALSISAINTVAMSAALAQEAPSPEMKQTIQSVNEKQGADRSAVVPVNPAGGITTFSADGVTAAPGGNGAYVAINVRGEGLHVDTAFVNYFPGTDIAGSNASAQAFELAWYEGGQRKSDVRGTDSGFLVASQQWDFNRDIDAGPMCGRVQIDGQWTNYACVEIN
ncbi:hypothetical protein [Corynebacterium timonense]|uniref:hypothetical protein n=1 Tax=Corynebacterium timonense TaxID=441500 RepID=UPI000308291A|nr:hypothetical protein [Corynebacterium timonense]